MQGVVLNIGNRVAGKSCEASLHVENLEDLITVVKSMKECGFPIVDELINDIMDSLMLIPVKQLKQGLVDHLDSNFTTINRSWGPISWGYDSVNVDSFFFFFVTVMYGDDDI
ncbi:hypothetical protein GQ457_14G022500 [Hibiscus cannabinus]